MLMYRIELDKRRKFYIKKKKYLYWCGDALLIATKTFALLPAHGLKHFVPNIVAVEAIFCGLLVVTERKK